MNDREQLIAIIERSIEAEDAAARHQRVLERLSDVKAIIWPSVARKAAVEAAGDVGRLPPEAIASMPEGYKPAPWILRGGMVPCSARFWSPGFGWSWINPGGIRCPILLEGLYAVPMDTPDPGDKQGEANA